MPHNCQIVSFADIIKYFVVDVDGMGILDGHFRNEFTPFVLNKWNDWKLCELTEDEFMRLIIPEESKPLLKDKDIASVEGDDSIATMQRYAKKLELGESLSPLIIRSVLPGDTENASYYIEDGAHRTLGYKIYFQTNPYTPVKAYIGKNK
ncbi:MAG TPA: hypothetical protein VNW29_02010 [Candidatus Sulfotelmatobacter sp.]|jgi:hypothetical protein|nr:hypothetical protein [Candidatus Sulfotelmatobacter sp.]